MDIQTAKNRIRAASTCYAKWSIRGPAMLSAMDQAAIALGGVAGLDRAGLIHVIREWPDSRWMHASIEDGNLDDINLLVDIEQAFADAEIASDWYAVHAVECLRASVMVARAFLGMPDLDERYSLWCEGTRYPYRDGDGRLFHVIEGRLVPLEDAEEF